jgi:hypothetical protein
MARHHWHIAGKVLTSFIALAAAGAGVVVASIIHHGLSAREESTLAEAAISRSVRHFATPASMRGARNPVSLNASVLAEARAHWADHCATCHANGHAAKAAELAVGQRAVVKMMIDDKTADSVKMSAPPKK